MSTKDKRNQNKKKFTSKKAIECFTRFQEEQTGVLEMDDDGLKLLFNEINKRDRELAVKYWSNFLGYEDGLLPKYVTQDDFFLLFRIFGAMIKKEVDYYRRKKSEKLDNDLPDIAILEIAKDIRDYKERELSSDDDVEKRSIQEEIDYLLSDLEFHKTRKNVSSNVKDSLKIQGKLVDIVRIFEAMFEVGIISSKTEIKQISKLFFDEPLYITQFERNYNATAHRLKEQASLSTSKNLIQFIKVLSEGIKKQDIENLITFLEKLKQTP